MSLPPGTWECGPTASSPREPAWACGRHSLASQGPAPVPLAARGSRTGGGPRGPPELRGAGLSPSDRGRLSLGELRRSEQAKPRSSLQQSLDGVTGYTARAGAGEWPTQPQGRLRAGSVCGAPKRCHTSCPEPHTAASGRVRAGTQTCCTRRLMATPLRLPGRQEVGEGVAPGPCAGSFLRRKGQVETCSVWDEVRRRPVTSPQLAGLENGQGSD